MCMFSSLSLNMHDVSIAVFKLSLDGETLVLDLTLDIDDLSQTIGVSREKVNMHYVEQYINLSSSFKFNDIEYAVSLSDYNVVLDHIKCHGTLGEFNGQIEKIDIESRCLLNIESQSNIIMLDFNDRSRDFRLHNARQLISVKY